MSLVTTDNQNYIDIANAIRASLNSNDTYRPDQMSSVIEDLGTTALESGRKAEYDRFWNAYQQNGNRADYGYAFAGYGWTNDTFYPKYNITPRQGSHLFSQMQVSDLVGRLSECGVVLDTSNLSSFNYLAQYSKIERFPVLDMRGAANLGYFLYGNDQLHTVDKVILRDDGSQTFTTYTFYNNTALREIRFEGVIGKNGLNFSQSPLSYESIVSIVNALQDKSGIGGDWVIVLGSANISTYISNGGSQSDITVKGWRAE